MYKQRIGKKSGHKKSKGGFPNKLMIIILIILFVIAFMLAWATSTTHALTFEAVQNPCDDPQYRSEMDLVTRMTTNALLSEGVGASGSINSSVVHLNVVKLSQSGKLESYEAILKSNGWKGPTHPRELSNTYVFEKEGGWKNPCGPTGGSTSVAFESVSMLLTIGGLGYLLLLTVLLAILYLRYQRRQKQKQPIQI